MAITERIEDLGYPKPLQDVAGARYPLLSLEPWKSLVWVVKSEADYKILSNRLNVYVNRVRKRVGRDFVVRKHIYRDDYITLEVTRVPDTI